MSIRIASPSLPFLLLAAVGLIGCGSGDETDNFTLVPVNGTVTNNGKPLEGASVTFTPDPSNAQSTPGTDTTGPEGNYKAMFRGRTGLAPGKYRVTVTKTILPPGATASGGEDDYMDQVAAESAAAGGRRGSQVAKEIREDFDREVPPSGGIVDMDVKATAKPIAAP